MEDHQSLEHGGRHLVYLDLNHWIYLAQAQTGTATSKSYHSVLPIALDLAANEQAIFPLSSFHLMEVAKIRDDKRRRHLAILMSALSRGWFLVSASSILLPCLRRAIGTTFKRPYIDQPIAPLSRSAKLALLVANRPDVFDKIKDRTFPSQDFLEAFLATARGSPKFIENLNAAAQADEHCRQMLWDVTREVRERHYCARVMMDIADRLQLVLEEFELTKADLEAIGPQGMTELLKRVPCLDMEINLHVERNEHRDRNIDPNDTIDLGLLSLAVPYCDAVVTERFWASLVQRKGLDKKYQTLVSHDLGQVLQAIETSGVKPKSPTGH